MVITDFMDKINGVASLIVVPFFVETLIQIVSDKRVTTGRVVILILSGLLTVGALVILLMGDTLADTPAFNFSVETNAESAESVPASGQDSVSAETAPQKSGSASKFLDRISPAVKIAFIVSGVFMIILTVWIWICSWISIDNLLENPLWVLSFAAFVLSAVIIAVSTLSSDNSFSFLKAWLKENDSIFEENAAVVYIDYEEHPPTTLTMTDARKFITEEGAVNIIANYQYVDERGDIKYQLSIVLDGDMFLDKAYDSKNKDDRTSHPASFDLKIRGTQYVTAQKAKKSRYVVEITDRNEDMTHYQGQFSVVAQRTKEKPGVWLFNCWEVIPPKTVYVKETVKMKGTFDFAI